MKISNPLIKLFYSNQELHRLEVLYENPLRRQLHLKPLYKKNYIAHDTY